MKKHLFIWVLGLVLGPAAMFAQSARQYLRAGDEFYRTMNYSDAIVQYTKAIDLDPGDERAYINRAMSYAQTGNHEEAARDFDRALVFDKKDEQLFYLSGREWHLQGDNHTALSKLNQALSHKGNFLEAYQLRAAVYMEMEQYDRALEDYQKCLRFQKDENGYYNLGTAYEKLGMMDEAEEAYQLSIKENNRIPGTYYSLSLLQLRRRELAEALQSVARMLELEPGNTEGRLLQAQILAAQGNYPKAIEVLSVASADDPEEALIYLHRGDIYRMMNQTGNAIIDYTRAIDLDPENPELYYKRGGAYEEIREGDKAMSDYEKLLVMSASSESARILYEEASRRMFDLNREEDKPRIVLLDPHPVQGNRIDIPREVQVLNIKGLVEDESDIQSLQVNGYTVPVQKTAAGKEFMASVNLSTSDIVTIQATDAYSNSETVIYPVRRTEVDPPVVRMIAPYSSEGNILYLDKGEPRIYMEGRISDESRIKNITVDSVMASYIPADLNPYFSALVDVENKNNVTVVVEDEYGNRSETVFTLNRDAEMFENNPMGKTWVVFIENSEYENFAALEGPSKDVAMMRAALSRYQVHNFVHMQDMTKDEMQRFFSIELRDMIRSNRINSLMIWYAGHGKLINETGYWLPVDAVTNDEFSYYNIGQLKASMEAYPDFLTHKLVITDACEAGPSFYRALRSDLQDRSCDDWTSTRLKSSQVFSSAADESASDDSQFTKTFSNVLASNPNNCLSIEEIVRKVTASMINHDEQRPQFGKISGLEDEDGTFFFVPKGY